MLRSIVERKWSGDIVTAETTEDAMDVIDKYPDITAAFIDYYIPTMNGPSIIKYLNKKTPSARIALVTSSSSDRLGEKARLAGAEAVVCTSDETDAVEKQLVSLIQTWELEMNE